MISKESKHELIVEKYVIVYPNEIYGFPKSFKDYFSYRKSIKYIWLVLRINSTKCCTGFCLLFRAVIHK